MIPSNLILESGEVFAGYAPKWQNGCFLGEVVFVTGMTGYVESLTDPSYSGQILVFTYPLIGNYGIPSKTAWESQKIQVNGVVIGTAGLYPSHWNSEHSLIDWLAEEQIPLISNIDTRELTKLLRKKGTTPGAICNDIASCRFSTSQENLVKRVSCGKKIILQSGSKKIVAVDCGMKENIVRHLMRYPIEIIRVPFDYDYSDEEFDGIFLSNGPGDPANCKEAIAILQKALKRKKPTFGICLGAQLLALAIGANTYKLKFGHRGQNHPCFDLKQNRAILTSQNHGYAIDEKSLPNGWSVTFKNLNDQSVEGIAHQTLPFFAVQFHPESSPGPTDAAYLFDRFYDLIQETKG